MYELQFPRTHTYSNHNDGVVIPVGLRSGSNWVPIFAIVDTGSSFCLFSGEVAEALGLDLTAGAHLRFRTANSSFEAYGHNVEITSFGISTSAMVYFFADPSIDKNVLGRTGWLDRVRLGMVHHDNTIFLGPYDQP